MTTAVESATARLGTLLTKRDVKWDVVAQALLEVREEALGVLALPEHDDVASVPVPVELSVTERQALGDLEEVLSEVDWPVTRTELTASQKRSLLILLHDEKVLGKLAERILKNVKLAVWNHLDVEAERKGRARSGQDDADLDYTPHDKHGFYAVDGSITDPTSGISAVRQVTEAKPVLTLQGLERAEAAGAITHAEFLKMTEQTRVFSEDKSLAAMTKDNSLGARLATYIEMTMPQTALVLKKNGN